MLNTHKVAAYCRVSTDREDQVNSFESQQRFFREYIDRQPDWALYDVYADEGLSGTSTKKRAAFNRMIADARLGRFNMIITKEISRFARNTLDSIQFTRELKRLGIAVFFLNDNINTMRDDSEIFLTIKSSMAQEESRATSSRVKWGQTQQMKRGIVFGRSCLGYDVRDGVMTLEPRGAEIVRLIYHKYVTERKGTSVIARELREAGVKTLTGSSMWKNSSILKILRNEKYCGDLCQKKTYTPDYLTHEKKYNRGEEEIIFLRDHHEPIIARELWDAAQRELKRRDVKSAIREGHGNRYPLSGKIKCGACGASFSARYKTLKDGGKRKVWRCFTATAYGKRKRDTAGNEVGCDIGRQLRHEAAMGMLKQSVDSLLLNRGTVTANLTKLIARVILESNAEEAVNVTKLEQQLAVVAEKKKSVLDAFFGGQVTKDEMRLMSDAYDSEITGLNERLAGSRTQRELHYEPVDIEKDIKAQIERIVKGKTETEAFYVSMLNQITVYADDTVDVTLNLLPTKWKYVLERLRATKEA